MNEFLYELRAANLDRLESFGHGGIVDGWNVAEWGCAIAGETGELCNILKKVIRQAPNDPPIEELVVEAEEEIADVLIYLDLLAAKLGIDLVEVTARKFNAVSHRYGVSVMLRAEDER